MGRRVCRLIRLNTSQAQIQGLELACPNIYPICILECRQGPALEIGNYRISVTQDNDRISNRSVNKIPVLLEWQEPEPSYQLLQGTSASKEAWTKEYTVGHTGTH